MSSEGKWRDISELTRRSSQQFVTPEILGDVRFPDVLIADDNVDGLVVANWKNDVVCLR